MPTANSFTIDTYPIPVSYLISDPGFTGSLPKVDNGFGRHTWHTLAPHIIIEMPQTWDHEGTPFTFSGWFDGVPSRQRTLTIPGRYKARYAGNFTLASREQTLRIRRDNVAIPFEIEDLDGIKGIGQNIHTMRLPKGGEMPFKIRDAVTGIISEVMIHDGDEEVEA